MPEPSTTNQDHPYAFVAVHRVDHLGIDKVFGRGPVCGVDLPEELAARCGWNVVATPDHGAIVNALAGELPPPGTQLVCRAPGWSPGFPEYDGLDALGAMAVLSIRQRSGDEPLATHQRGRIRKLASAPASAPWHPGLPVEASPLEALREYATYRQIPMARRVDAVGHWLDARSIKDLEKDVLWQRGLRAEVEKHIELFDDRHIAVAQSTRGVALVAAGRATKGVAVAITPATPRRPNRKVEICDAVPGSVDIAGLRAELAWEGTWKAMSPAGINCDIEVGAIVEAIRRHTRRPIE